MKLTLGRFHPISTSYIPTTTYYDSYYAIQLGLRARAISNLKHRYLSQLLGLNV